MSVLDDQALKEKTLRILEEARRPASITFVAKRLEVAWNTARLLLLTLEHEGLAESIRTTTGTLFVPQRRMVEA